MLPSIQELEDQFKETSYSNPYGSRLLADICQNHFEKIVRYLQEGLNPNMQDRDGNTLLCKALEYNQDEIAWFLLGNNADPNKHGVGRSTALMLSKNAQTTFFLLKAGATLYTKAESDTHFYLPRTECFDSLKQIINAGFDVNTQGPNGQTLFHSAIASNQKEVIEYVVSKGADIQATTICGVNGADFAQMPHISPQVRSYIQQLKVIPTQKKPQQLFSCFSKTDKISLFGGMIIIAAGLFLAIKSAAQKESPLKDPSHAAQTVTQRTIKKNTPFFQVIQKISHRQNTL